MISSELGCVFVHIPKTGGTSIEDAIWGPDRSARTSDMLWMGGDDPKYRPYVSGRGPLQHLRARDIREIVGDEAFERHVTFAVVRNPWDRLVSQYHHFLSMVAGSSIYEIAADAPFGDYLERLASGGRDLHCQTYTQTSFLVDDAGETLVDHVGRFESLGDFYREIAAVLGVDAALPHNMRSSDREATASYFTDPAARRHAEMIYAEDIERFAYTMTSD